MRGVLNITLCDRLCQWLVGAVVIVIVWKLDLQLPLQSVHITTHVHGEVYLIHHYVIKVCPWLAKGLWFSPGTQGSSTNKTDHHDIAEIVLKVALNTITLTTRICVMLCFFLYRIKVLSEYMLQHFYVPVPSQESGFHSLYCPLLLFDSFWDTNKIHNEINNKS